MCYNEKRNSTKNFEFYFCRAGGGMEELCDIARMCSSEVEYSDENLQATLDEFACFA